MTITITRACRKEIRPVEDLTKNLSEIDCLKVLERLSELGESILPPEKICKEHEGWLLNFVTARLLVKSSLEIYFFIWFV